MNILKINLFSVFFISILTFSNSTFAEQKDEFDRYYSAKIQVAYKGELGHFLQTLSLKLDIAYFSYKTDFSHKIVIDNPTTIDIKTLLEQIKTQVPNVEIGFKKIGETITLVIYNSSSPLKLQNRQFIGEVIFSE